MAQIDSSIYQQRQTPDILGSIQRGMQMRDMMDQRKADQALKESAKNAMVTDEKGNTSFDQKRYLSDLYKINPQKAIETEQAFKTISRGEEKQKLESAMKKIEITGRLLSSAVDQPSYEMALKNAQSLGIDVSNEPRQFDPNYVKANLYKTVSAKEQLALQWQQKKFDQDQSWKDKEFALKERELGLKRQDVNYKREEERKKLNDPDQRVKKLNSGDKARFDNALMALKALDEMGQALDNGDNTFSVFGDNDYTAAERRATEAYGRMQSGGAISESEEKRFNATLPDSREPKERQRQKILAQRDEMISRLRTLGFTPEDVGYQPKEFKYGSSGKQKSTSNQPPQTIIQNGHTYTYNPKTGGYE